MQSVEPEAGTMVLHKIPMWSQQERILDLAVVEGNPAHMLVLDSNSVTFFRMQDSGWQQEQSLPITHSRSWPRDLRGRLMLRKDFLCRSTAGTPPTMTCYDSDAPWPIATDPFSLNAFFTASRNFFTGSLSPGLGKQTTVPAFYSAAALPRDKSVLWLFAAVDGYVHLLDGVTDQVIETLNWGSDVAAVRSSCGSGWQVLATGYVERSSDTVRAFEVAGRAPIAASPPLELNGSITALWTESVATGAVAVVRDSDLGRYEAFRLTLSCFR